MRTPADHRFPRFHANAHLAPHLLLIRVTSFSSHPAERHTTYPNICLCTGRSEHRSPTSPVPTILVDELNLDRQHLARDLITRHNMWCYTLDKHLSRAHICSPSRGPAFRESPSFSPPPAPHHQPVAGLHE